jgi:two-component system KDP operon response regulator KdpE
MTDPYQTKQAVLIVEDDRMVRRFVGASLQESGWKIHEASTARQAMVMIGTHHPDLVLLDLGLPDQDGRNLLKDLRSWSQIPIIVISGRAGEFDKIAALESGADDYVTKPFSIGELVARINTAHRRRIRYSQHANGHLDKVVFGDVEVDLMSRRVTRAGIRISLTPTEYRLLTYLIQNEGRVSTHNQILSSVWSGKHQDDVQYLRVYMRRLRQKLEKNPANPEYILTESAVGYLFAL